MSVTIKQLAERAGVSRGTVDRVLHDRPGVSADVVAHVRAVADEMGFVPSRAGKLSAMRNRQLRIGCVYPTYPDDFERGINDAVSELSEYGVTITPCPISGYEPERYANAIMNFVSEEYDALCVTAADSPEVRAAIRAAAEKNVPVITVGMDIEGSDRLCYIGGDYEVEGATAASMLALQTSGDIHLLLATGPLSLPHQRARAQAFSSTLVEKGVKSKLVSVFEEHGDYTRTYATALEALKNRPEINCIYVAGEGITAICRAVETVGRQKETLIITSDCSAAARKLIRDGTVGFAAGQDFYESGSHAVRAVFDYFAGGKAKIPSDYSVGIRILIKENC